MSDSTAIPKGSLVLVTGVNGFIASHVARELLERGFRVRGTVRNTSKVTFMNDLVFPEYAKKGTFDMVNVPDLGVPNAFDEVIRGAGFSAIVHVASPLTFDPDPNNVIPQTIAGTENILQAAAREESIKRFVYTSSAPVAIPGPPFQKAHATKDSWNELFSGMAWAPPPYTPERGAFVYLASKLEAEKAVWKFVEEKKPGFVVNTVLPYTTLGKALHKSQHRGSSGWVRDLYNGQGGMLATMQSPSYVNVRDVSLLHAAGVLDPDVKGERLLAWSDPFNANDILAVLRKREPDHKFVDDFPSGEKGAVTKDDKLEKSLFKKWAGRDDWLSLEETIAEGLEPVPE